MVCQLACRGEGYASLLVGVVCQITLFSPQHPVCIEAYFGLGKCLEKQYRLDEAADYLSKSADLAPEAAEYQLAAGQALKGLGQNAKALDYFQGFFAILCDYGKRNEVISI